MDAELEVLQKEVQRKIGRNILICQQIEVTLKILLANSQLSGYESEIDGIKEKQASKISNKTMGYLVGEFIGNINHVHKKTPKEPEELKEIWFCFDCMIKSNGDYYKERKSRLACIVNERNELTHHFLTKYDLNSIQGCKEADKYLDQQREKTIPEFEHLQNLVKSLQKAREITAAFFHSAEFEKLFDEIERPRRK